MAVDLIRSTILEAYRQTMGPGGFLQSLFTVKPGGISDTQKVIVDVVRNTEAISPVVAKGGTTNNTANVFTTKEFEPPTINELMSVDSEELFFRQPGVNAFDASDVQFQEQLLGLLISGMSIMGEKIARNVEWQASQILQTGILVLKDINGNNVYTIDFLPKSSHNPDAGTDWDTGAPLDDIEALGDVIRIDGLATPDQLIFGANSARKFQRNPQVVAALDTRRITLGAIDPRLALTGAKSMGSMHIGPYEYDMWTYDGRGVIPGASVSVPMVDPDSCIVRAKSGRLDTVFGGVPGPVRRDPRFTGMLPDRLSIPGVTSVSPNVYASQNGKLALLELESRPLCIPVGIDTFGNINTAP